MLAKLAIKNIRKSVKDYAIFFLTLVLGVAIFYVFNALDSQTVMMDVSQSTQDLIQLMLQMLSGVSVFVAVILGLLIVYASRFLMKRRKMEFGIYLTLGMSKWKVSLILLMETLMIGIVSLGVGLIAGVLLSQLMSLIVINMFEADMTKFAFVFSPEACQKTMYYFGIMYLIVIVFNTASVGRQKLINLINGGRQAEKIKMKNPWVSSLVFVVAVAILGRAYHMVVSEPEIIADVDKILIPIAMGALATLLIFWSLSGLMLKLTMSIKGLYYKGLNSFVLRQFSNKINTTVVSSTVICLMLFVTICLLSSCLTIKNSMNANIKELTPADIMAQTTVKWEGKYNGDYLTARYSEEQIKNDKMTPREVLEELGFDLMDNLQDYVEVKTYADQNLTMGLSLGNELSNIQQSFPFLAYDTLEPIMKLSDYNKVAKFYGNNEYALNEDEYLIVADFKSMVELRNTALQKNTPIKVFGQTLKARYNACQDGFVEMSSNHINTGVVVVPDKIVDENAIFSNTIIGNYNFDDKAKVEEFETKLDEATKSEVAKKYPNIDAVSKFSIREATTGLSAMVTFIGLYIGVIFLTASATILALKELSESSDNQTQFMMLRRLGVEENKLNRALLMQIAIFFLLPLLLALLHSVFGMMFATKILEVFGDEQMMASMVMCAIFMVVIYGGYFGLTYLMSKKMVKERI